MTWRQKTLVRILLLVAQVFADDPAVADEIRSLATHIAVWAPKAEG